MAGHISRLIPASLWVEAQESSQLNLQINSLGPSGAIWHRRSWSKLVQVMACCLIAPSHYLNQYWLINSKVLWHSSEDIIIRRFEDTNQQDWITLISPRSQWVNDCWWLHRVHSKKYAHGLGFVMFLSWFVIGQFYPYPYRLLRGTGDNHKCQPVMIHIFYMSDWSKFQWFFKDCFI